jgi:hypothetical protein
MWTRSHLDKAVAAVWRDIPLHPLIGVEANFWPADSGGHYLHGRQLEPPLRLNPA